MALTERVKLTAEVKASLMAYCVIDILEPGDEELLEEFYNAALDYMDDAGVAMPVEGTPRRAKYDLCVKALVLQDWDNRGATGAGNAAADNPAFRRRMNQLKHSEPVSITDAGCT